MTNVPLLDELRATRRHLAEEAELSVEHYAAMLRGMSDESVGNYVTEPFLPTTRPPNPNAFKEAS